MLKFLLARHPSGPVLVTAGLAYTVAVEHQPTAELSRKLNPSRFPGMSPLMAAVVGYVLGESFTDPPLAQIAVSEAENLVYIRRAGAAGFDGIQSLEDLRNNWNRLLDAAGLTGEERREAVGLFNVRVVNESGTHPE